MAALNSQTVAASEVFGSSLVESLRGGLGPVYGT